MAYQLHDTFGAPQCGYHVTEFETWWELEECLDANPDTAERIRDGYARIVEVDE